MVNVRSKKVKAVAGLRGVMVKSGSFSLGSVEGELSIRSVDVELGAQLPKFSAEEIRFGFFTRHIN